MLKVKSIKQYASKKILAFDDAVKLIAKIKLKGNTVGLCHGGFDLVHPGHVKHFESAKRLCDVLFVSVTSDRFVESRKGLNRPIYPAELRVYMIAGIEYVDYVVISDFKRGVDVINRLKSSYYIKGPDFINKATPGITAEREAIANVGGEIKYTNDPKLSTTEIIDYRKSKISNKSILLVIDRDGTIIKNNDFLGKNKNWINEIEFNEDVISLLSYLQTKCKTTKLIITNQAGVARRFFDCKRVNELNNHIDSELVLKGIKIDNWQYCPFVDSLYASKHPELDLDPKYVKSRTRRKPDKAMLLDGLKELKKDIKQFDKIIVIGDRQEDKDLADNLNAQFVDVNNKNYEKLLKEVKNI